MTANTVHPASDAGLKHMVPGCWPEISPDRPVRMFPKECFLIFHLDKDDLECVHHIT